MKQQKKHTLEYTSKQHKTPKKPKRSISCILCFCFLGLCFVFIVQALCDFFDSFLRFPVCFLFCVRKNLEICLTIFQIEKKMLHVLFCGSFVSVVFCLLILLFHIFQQTIYLRQRIFKNIQDFAILRFCEIKIGKKNSNKLKRCVIKKKQKN